VSLTRQLLTTPRPFRLKPQRAETYWGRAHVYEEKGEFDKAIADFTESVRLNPQCAETYCGRAYAYREKGEFDKAIPDYTEAIRLNRSMPRRMMSGVVPPGEG